MLRRVFILGGLVVPLALGAKAASLDAVVAQLEQQGYVIESVERTFLGRLRIEARRGLQERELVLNPSTGEVLRDYWEVEDSDGEDNDD